MRRSLLTYFALSVLTIGLSACVVRTQEFHCVMDGNPGQTFEMSMTPTSLVYQSTRLSFREEKGAQRLYTDPEGRLQVRFNPVSGELVAEVRERAVFWQCKRYEPFL